MTPDSTRRLWDSPIYKFRIKENPENENLIELIFDVTGSAPGFKEPSEELKEILTELFSSNDFKIDNVMEFGAAKLKNIPYILSKGKSICAVEFEQLTKSNQTKENLKICRRFTSKFENLIFPNPFINHSKKYDLILLLNVLPVMPVFAERLYLLDLLFDKLKSEKYILWLVQKEGSYKTDRLSGKYFCGDGLWQGKSRYFKTFYKYISKEDIDELMSLYGFKLIKRWNYGSDACLYQKTNHNLFHGLINEQRILNLIPFDDSIQDPTSVKPKIVKIDQNTKMLTPNPRDLSIESLYIEKIKSIPEGPEYAELYHRVSSNALARIFRGSLRNMDIKQNIKDGIKIIDTLFTNCAKEGFFLNLKEEIKCNYPIVEVKNYTDDTKNPEVDQLNGRFNTNHGHFGIIVCRHLNDEDKMYKRCATVLPDSIILFLTDKDIFELLELSRDNSFEDISDFMDKKLRRLLFEKS